MTNLKPKENNQVPDSEKSAVDQFLKTIGKKTNDPIHHRLLKVCQNESPTTALETEFKLIISEIINEN